MCRPRSAACPLAIAPLILLLLLGCSSPKSATDHDSLVYWRTLTGGAGNAQDELVQRFSSKHPGTPVKAEFQGSYADLAAKLTAAAISGAGPDVAQLGTFEIRQFAKAGALVDLRSFAESSDGLDVANWPGTVAKAGEVDGGLYWLPFNVTVPILYYNPDAFASAGIEGPPKTWAEFHDQARRLTVRDDRGEVTRAGVALWNITWPLISAIWSERGELTDRNYTNITLDDPVVVEVMTSFQQLIREGAAEFPTTASGGHRAAFTSGRAAMILDSPAPYDEIMGAASGFTPMTAMYPEGRAGRVYAPGGGGLVMLSIAPESRRASAWSFIKYMLSPDSLAYYAQRSGYPDFVRAASAPTDESRPDSHQAVLRDALPFLRGDFSVTMSPSVRNAFDEAYQKIMVDMADVRTTLAEADKRAESGVRAELGVR